MRHLISKATDGVPEARGEGGELYGFERTRVLLSTRPTAESVAHAACDFGQEDDITVLTIEPIRVSESSVEARSLPNVMTMVERQKENYGWHHHLGNSQK